MKKIFSSYNLVQIGIVKTILDDNGIESVIKNYFLSGAIGDLPANECVPELWVLDSADYEEAEKLVKDFLRPVQSGTPWVCATCGEKVPANFAICWKCGSPPP